MFQQSVQKMSFGFAIFHSFIERELKLWFFLVQSDILMTFTHFSSLFTFHWFSRFSNVISKWENSYYFWIQIFTHYLSNFCSKVKSKYFNGCSFWSLVLPSIFSIRRQWAFSADDFSLIFFLYISRWSLLALSSALDKACNWWFLALSSLIQLISYATSPNFANIT